MLILRHCYHHYRALGLPRLWAMQSAWRDAQGTADMHTGIWPLLTIIALSYAAGAGSALFVAGLVAVWRRARRARDGYRLVRFQVRKGTPLPYDFEDEARKHG